MRITFGTDGTGSAETAVGVRAECHSDDFVFKARFDAEPWFAQASNTEILNLAKCEWRGDYPADVVAQHFDTAGNRDVEIVMEYTRNKVDMGFECVVDADDAMRWARDNKPDLFAELCQVTNSEPSDYDGLSVPAGP